MSDSASPGARNLTPAPFDRDALERLPAARDLASDLLVVDPRDPDFAAPAITNQWAGLVAGREPFAYAGLSTPQLFSEGTQAELFLGLAGEPLAAAGELFRELTYRWYPSRLERSGEWRGLGFRVVTSLSTRDQVVLNRLTVTNPAREAATLDLFVRVLADLRSEWSMAWPPADTARARLGFDAGRRALTMAAPDSEAFALMGANHTPVGEAGFSGDDDPRWSESLASGNLHGAADGGRQGALHFRAEIEPGGEYVLEWVHALGGGRAGAEAAFDTHRAEFADILARTDGDWEREWRAAFTGGSAGAAFSGHAPVVTADNPKLERLYYMGIMTLLQCKRTPVFGGPAEVYLTGFPSSQFTFHNNWVFPWDTMMISGILSLLDPATLKKMIHAWLEADLHEGCAIDFTTGAPVGFWYAVNDYALIHMVWQYVRYTGDTDFLDLEVRGRPVPAHLRDAALYYRRIAGEDGLADYGGAENLLECVSTYTHKVASFNAANVWNLRTVAEMLEARGDSAGAAELRELASGLVPEIMKLYVPGDGVWSCLQPDGSRVVVRHCLDFHTVAQCLRDDLSTQQKDEMIGFFLRELKTTTWMHALSPLDPDTASSSRTDHQDEGAYTTWPAYAFEVLMAEGREAEAMAWLGDADSPGFADVTRQGAFGQAYCHGDDDSPTLAGAGAKAPMEMPHIEKPVLVPGGKYAQIVLEAVLGVDPRPFGSIDQVNRSVGTRVAARNLNLRGENIHAGGGED